MNQRLMGKGWHSERYWKYVGTQCIRREEFHVVLFMEGTLAKPKTRLGRQAGFRSLGSSGGRQIVHITSPVLPIPGHQRAGWPRHGIQGLPHCYRALARDELQECVTTVVFS